MRVDFKKERETSFCLCQRRQTATPKTGRPTGEQRKLRLLRVKPPWEPVLGEETRAITEKLLEAQCEQSESKKTQGDLVRTGLIIL